MNFTNENTMKDCRYLRSNLRTRYQRLDQIQYFIF